LPKNNKNKMKQITLVALLLLIGLQSCKKDSGHEAADDFAGSPRSEVPDELIAPNGKYWRYGTISSINYHDTYSDTYRNAFGLSLFLEFRKNGTYKFMQYLNSGNYATLDQLWLETEGTVTIGTAEVDGVAYPTFTLHPVKGIERIRTATKNEQRKLNKEALVGRGNLSATFFYGRYLDQGKHFLDILNTDGTAPIQALHEEW
jgi:hypothetical protein